MFFQVMFCFYVFKVTYCSLTCQKLHWFTHKRMCRSLQEQDADLEKDTPRLKELKGAHLLFCTIHLSVTMLWIDVCALFPILSLYFVCNLVPLRTCPVYCRLDDPASLYFLKGAILILEWVPGTRRWSFRWVPGKWSGSLFWLTVMLNWCLGSLGSSPGRAYTILTKDWVRSGDWD